MSWDNGDAGPSANWDTGDNNDAKCETGNTKAAKWETNNNEDAKWDTGNKVDAKWETGKNKVPDAWPSDKDASKNGLTNGHENPEEKVARPFTGACRICQVEGHPAADCPSKPAQLCRNCKKEGHLAKDCTENRFMDTTSIEVALPDIAWAKLKAADDAKDLDDFRDALKIYCKAVPESTYAELERGFRTQNFRVHLIAREKVLSDTMTFVDLQGRLNRKFEVGFFFSYKPTRKIFAQGWPQSPGENLARLADAGLPMDRGIPKCTRCSELGHVARECSQEAGEVQRVQVKCVNCDEVGHRARDCTQPRVDKYACRNCKKSGHHSSDCPEPRSAEGVECKRCNETGHFAKDCPTGGKQECRNCGEEGHKAAECEKPKDPARSLCRNCDTVGHFARDCPQPKDWSKVKCNRCNEMGHTVKRCPLPEGEVVIPISEDPIPGVNGRTGAAKVANGDDWETARAAGIKVANEDDWGTAPAAGDNWESNDQPTSGGAAW